MPSKSTRDATLDLVLTRVVDVPRPAIWRAWTEPEILKQWFCPRPWTTPLCEMDLRPGGRFRTVMRSPEGQEHETNGCFLEVEKPSRLVWTTALGAGFRPVAQPDSSGVPHITAVLSFATNGPGTRYTALALHASEAGRKAHEAMGFHEGWGAALDQLVELARRMPT